jgi:hypothetical protein
VAERLAYRHHAGRDEAIRGLVEQEQSGIAQQGSRDPQALLHAE